jgi:hypothetical protein
MDRLHDGLRAQVRAAAGRSTQPSAAVIDSRSMVTAESSTIMSWLTATGVGVSPGRSRRARP